MRLLRAASTLSFSFELAFSSLSISIAFPQLRLSSFLEDAASCPTVEDDKFVSFSWRGPYIFFLIIFKVTSYVAPHIPSFSPSFGTALFHPESSRS